MVETVTTGLTVDCNACGGRGAWLVGDLDPASPAWRERCGECDGTGQVDEICGICNAVAVVIDPRGEDALCAACAVRTEAPVDVTVPGRAA